MIMPPKPTTSRSGARSLMLAAPLLAGALALTACRGFERLDDPTAVALNDPEQRHAIALGGRPETLVVEVPPDAGGLSRNQQTDVIRFVDRYKSEARGRLRLSTPAAARDRQAAARLLRDVQALVEEAGLDRQAVHMLTHPADRRGERSVQLSFEKVVAIPPVCRDWSEDIGVNHERLPYPQFGCASQTNLAVMLDNPRDLVRPRDESPRPADKTAGGISKYAGGGGSSDGGGANSAQGATDSAGKAGGGPAVKQ